MGSHSEKSLSGSQDDVTKPQAGHGAVVQVPSGAGNEAITWTPREEAKVLRKVDLFLLPTVWIMSLLAWMDRANLGNASIAGLTAELNLTSTQFSLAISTFYFGYIAAVPFAMTILSRTKPSITIPAIMGLWGVVTACMGAMTTFPQLIGLRTLLGALESIFNPGATYLFSNWYRPDEMGKRASYYMSAAQVGGAFGSLIAGGVMEHLEGARGIRGWRWLFIVEGVVTVVASLLAMLTLPDYPTTWRRLSAEQKVIATNRLTQVGIVTAKDGDSSAGKKVSVKEAIRISLSDWRTYGIAIAAIFLCGSLLIVYFYPVLVKGLGYDNPVKAQYMTVPLWVVGFVFSILSGIIGDRIPQHRAIVIVAGLSTSVILAIATCFVFDFTARYVLIAFMTGGVWAAFSGTFALCAELFQDVPPEVRALTLGIMSMASNTGNVYGAYLWPKEHAPKYLLGFGMVAATAGMTSIIFTAMWLKQQQERRAKMRRETQAEGI
ncbi:putative transporter-like protein 21 [Rhypophila decipiens]|uniref:Transporter-like protein 21 n=1 Tax=Rhypophila decipiens TaxID=261697 RepID=A0AAN6XZF7_9PEZI|nr:putative transporter-like protein 21 [Rhypophila decipiens]